MKHPAKKQLKCRKKFCPNEIDRRTFIKIISVCTAWLSFDPLFANFRKVHASFPEHRIVSIHHNQVTNWHYPGTDPTTGIPTGEPQRDDQGRGYYDYVNQEIIYQMVDSGICRLTGEPTPQQAWQTLLTNYNPNQSVAIKVNWNGISDMLTQDRPSLESIRETTNAVIHGLLVAGVPENKIYVGDPSNMLVYGTGPHYKNLYPNVNWVERSWPDSENSDYALNNPSAKVDFTGTDADQNKYIANFIVDGDHLINICLFKTHVPGITGAFKNHFGSIYNCETLHSTLNESGYSCLAHINRNLHIKDKTRLIIGDAIFGCWYQNKEPNPFKIFNDDSPKTMFFSTDPVALDSVLLDYMICERETTRDLWVAEHHWLHYIQQYYPELGIHEHWNNSQDKIYTTIEYNQFDISSLTSRKNIDSKIKDFKNNNTSYDDVISTIQNYFGL